MQVFYDISEKKRINAMKFQNGDILVLKDYANNETLLMTGTIIDGKLEIHYDRAAEKQ